MYRPKILLCVLKSDDWTPKVNEREKRNKNKQKVNAKNNRDDIGISNHPEDATNEGEETTENVQDADHKVEHVHCFFLFVRKKDEKEKEKRKKNHSLTKKMREKKRKKSTKNAPKNINNNEINTSDEQ